MTEHQNWIQDKFGFLWLHIRHKELRKLSDYKSQTWEASSPGARAHNIYTASTDSMQFRMRSIDTTLQPQHVKSLTTALGCSLVDQQVMAMDQFTQMRSML